MESSQSNISEQTNPQPSPEQEQAQDQTAAQANEQPTEPSNERSYFQRRIFDEIGLTPKQNRITLRYETGVDERDGKGTFDIFSEDEEGTIKIRVFTLAGWLVQYPDPNMGKTYDHSSITRLKEYFVTRIAPQNIKDEDAPKYRFPKGQGIYPFFPPNLLEKFRKKEDIDTLILTEGYFKSMCASLHGFYVVGLGSITHYADSNTHELHQDIKLLINTCHVKKVVLLYDGDCLNISMKDFAKHRDLSRRPRIFYNAIMNTRDLLIDFSAVRIEFAHVKSENLVDHPKGLDDLLLTPAYKGKAEEILKDLTEDDINGRYFFRMNVRDQFKRLKKHFYLDSIDNFYKHWAEVIGESEFIYERMVYLYDKSEEKVQRAMPLAIKDFVRVGDDYFEMIQRPNIRTGQLETKLVPRRKQTIVDDFGRDQLANIHKYKAFINMPSHVDYKAVVADCFNLYSPLNYEAQPGPFPHIKALMEHIFGEQVELGYDYMQLLYLKPMQILPILCLVSNERGTGKTSFLDLLREMFGNNAIIVGNSEITSEFNALVSGKLIVGVDETSLEDNTKVTERLKMMSTAKRLPMQRKGKDHEEIENFTKYVLCSNNETRFIYTQEDEIRFWVRKIAPIPPQEVVPEILPIICEEIPGFLSFLISRQMSVKESKSRMWFTEDMIETQALRDLKAAQQPLPVKEIKEAIKTLFLDFPKEEYIISISVLKSMVPEIQRLPAESIRTYLRQHLNVPDAVDYTDGINKTRYIKIPYYGGTDGKTNIYYWRDKAKAFIFRAKDFLSEKEYEFVHKQVIGQTVTVPPTPKETPKETPEEPTLL